MRDDATLWEWEPFNPAELAQPLNRLGCPWWIAGGRALDLWLGRETRPHKDVDVALLRSDQDRLCDALGDWDLHYATPEQMLEPWDGSPLELPVHGIWARRSADAPWLCEFLLNETEAGEWVYRRDSRVKRPLERISGQNDDGVPFLAPEIVLLYKAKAPGATDEADFELAAPRLESEGREWLQQAIARAHPESEWPARL